MALSALLTLAPEGGYIAFHSETGTTTQGEIVEEALANLREATELYLMCCAKPPRTEGWYSGGNTQASWRISR